MVKNYISVTAGKDIGEANAILNEFQKAGYSLDRGYAPAVGIQISEKTMKGIKPNNFRMARFEDVPSLVELVSVRAMPVIHYNTKNLDTLFSQISKAFENSYSHCKLVQVNANFPEKSQLEKIKDKFNELKISLQIDYRGLDLEDAANKIVAYGDCADYILIDPSRGTGHAFDFDSSTDFYLRIKDKRPEYGIVLAGGFSGDNAEGILGKVIGKIKTKDFSICAEGQLRDRVSDEHWGQDILNIEKMRGYLLAVKRVFG